MKELERLKKGSTAYKAYVDYLTGEGIELPSEQYGDYYWAGLSVLDVIRLHDKDNQVTEGEIEIRWTDNLGQASKKFYSFKDIRNFLQQANPIRQYFNKK